MATKPKAQVKEEAPDKEAEGAPDSPLPLLDLNDAGVKKMIKAAKKRGFVTFDALNAVLPSESTSPEQIEDIMAMLSEMGINVVETEDAEGEDGETEKAADEHDDDDDEETAITVVHVPTDEELGFIFAEEGEYVFESNLDAYFDDFVDDDAERFVERLYENLRADLPKYEVETKA